MELTTGTLLRRIVETELSTSAHKLATLILDGMAWKEGYNGLERGTAAFTLVDLARKMGVSRQYLFELLCELEASPSGLSVGNHMAGMRPGCFVSAVLMTPRARLMSCHPQMTPGYIVIPKTKLSSLA